MSPEETQNGWTPEQIQRLKQAVIGMGVLIVIGLFLLVGGIYYKSGKKSTAPEAATPRLLLSGNTSVVIPPGSEVTHLAAGDGIVAVHLKKQNGGEILLIDIKSGQLVSRVTLAPAQ